MERVVLLDYADGRLHQALTAALEDPSSPDFPSYDRLRGDFWYFCVREIGCLERDDLTYALHNHQIIVDKMVGLFWHQLQDPDRTIAPCQRALRDLPDPYRNRLQRSLPVPSRDALVERLTVAAEAGLICDNEHYGKAGASLGSRVLAALQELRSRLSPKPAV